MTDVLQECTDRMSRRVVITKSTVTHIRRRHIEMVPHLGKICDVLQNPSFIYYRERTDSYFYYKLGVLTGAIASNYMVVIVKYDAHGEGLVKTTYSTGRPASGDGLVTIARSIP